MKSPITTATPPAPSPAAAVGRALEVNYHDLLARAPDAMLLIDIDSTRVLDANASACALFGLPGHALPGMALADLCPPFQAGGESSAALLAAHLQHAVEAGVRVFEAGFVRAGGQMITCEVRLLPLPAPHQRLAHARITDITRRLRDDALRLGQNHLLEMVARGAPLSETLDSLMRLIESQSDGLLCSVMLLDEDGLTMHPAAGPSLPADYLAALDGAAIGPTVGSCGTAMYRKETVIVADVMSDPLWEPYHQLVAPHGLRACWSTPIVLDQNQVLGSFALYYREVRRPNEDDMRLIDVATHLAGIAIERTRREAELTRHRAHLEELVAARTTALTLANEDLACALETLSHAQQELVRRDKMAALGALVAGVAHELNTPIGNSLMITTSMAEETRMLAAGLAGGLRRSMLEHYLDQAEQAGAILTRNLGRAAKLVSSFKQVATDHSSSQRRSFRVSELIAELLPPLRIMAKHRPITLRSEVDATLAMDSYPGPLSDVLTILFENCLAHAFDADTAGTVLIAASGYPDGMIAIAVTDDGAGIAPELADRVYDPFVTARMGSGGSGLGLHVAHNIVSDVLGGKIELETALGKGSTFRLLLPAIAPELPGPGG